MNIDPGKASTQHAQLAARLLGDGGPTALGYPLSCWVLHQKQKTMGPFTGQPASLREQSAALEPTFSRNGP